MNASLDNAGRSAGIAVAAMLAAAAPARADFFDDARRTVQTDIPNFFQRDVPHFFQDDIPCAFGGKPTSHTRTSCKPDKPAPRQPDADQQPARSQEPAAAPQ